MLSTDAVPIDLLDLHLRDDRGAPFANPRTHFGWDEKLGVFATLTPEASRAAFASTDWHALEFNTIYERLSDRLNVAFTHSVLALSHLPLSAEGDRHRSLRRALAAHLSSRTVALQERIPELIASHLDALHHRDSVELMAEFVIPVVDQVNELLCDAPAPDVAISVSRIFDSLIGVRSRQRIEDGLRAICDEVTQRGNADEEALGRAMVLHILGGDSLGGTLGESLAATLMTHKGWVLSDIDFGETFTATSVPYIERRAVIDTHLCGRDFAKDSRLRVYLLQFLHSADHADAAGLFGHGRHLCLGKRVSNIVWRELARQLGGINRTVTDVAYKVRPSDYIFAYPEAVRVSLQ